MTAGLQGAILLISAKHADSLSSEVAPTHGHHRLRSVANRVVDIIVSV
ncbi:hypothetical protein [Rhodococcus sp. IEGM 1330]|nr:hypothetical protein [Rhodococcus sp. IEGM 1330]MDV8023531.1 hypothetical protein [Rhodococcus sp. IEGM 1330]